MSILDDIFAYKRAQIASQMQIKPMSEVRSEVAYTSPPMDFLGALRSGKRRTGRPALIAEIKRASPSRGLLNPDLDPVNLAQIYQQNGAAAISVLTEEHYFQGHLDSLTQIAQLTPANGSRLPLLRKDFLCDPYQIYEARAAGADAVLLIAAYLDLPLLSELHTLTLQLGMAPLVEVHSLEELQKALNCHPVLIGINNRNLHDFSVDLQTTSGLRPFIPAAVCVVAESGIHASQDVDTLASAGIDAILVGEALVTAPDIAEKVRDLSGVGNAEKSREN